MKKQLPKNWVEVSLKEVTKNRKGKKPNIQSEVEFEGSIPYMDIKALEHNIIRQFADVESSKLFEEGDIAMVWDGARSGWVSKTNFGAIGSTLVAFQPISFNSNYLFYYLLEKYPFINSNARGVGIPHVDPTVLWDLKFPLAPISEQNRIVKKLDNLFSQLETIKTSMVNIPLLLKDFRQQVLTQAVTGKLTSKNDLASVSLPSTITIGNLFGEAPLNWKWVKLIDIAKLESGHTPRKSEEEYWVNGNVPWISLQDIRSAHGKIIIQTKYMPNELGIKKSSARLLPKGTVCFCRDISVGFTTVMGKEMSTTQHFANWICGDSLNNMFLLYSFMSSKDFLIASGKGTTVGTIYMPALKELRILLPPIAEQQEIVLQVESLFAKADAIEKQYKSLKEKIDKLPQALLHKAFKGELTEQLVSDGNAAELLKEIASLRATRGKVGKKVGKTVKRYEEKEVVLDMVAEPREKTKSKVVKLKPTNAEIYKRTLLAAEIVYQLKETNTLGHLKLQKMLYLCQEIGSMNLPMNFLKQAMGPYDNLLARSLDKQFVVKKWFEYQKEALLKYKPLENCGNHKEDFQKYFETEVEQVNYLINKFKKFTSNQIEAVATLYACWKEAIEKKELITDKLIITKFYQWSKEKEKFREENLFKALDWMRRNGVEPK